MIDTTDYSDMRASVRCNYTVTKPERNKSGVHIKNSHRALTVIVHGKMLLLRQVRKPSHIASCDMPHNHQRCEEICQNGNQST